MKLKPSLPGLSSPPSSILSSLVRCLLGITLFYFPYLGVILMPALLGIRDPVAARGSDPGCLPWLSFQDSLLVTLDSWLFARDSILSSACPPPSPDSSYIPIRDPSVITCDPESHSPASCLTGISTCPTQVGEPGYDHTGRGNLF